MGILAGLLSFSGSHKSTILLLVIMAPVFLGGVWFGSFLKAREARKINITATENCKVSVEHTARQTREYCEHVRGQPKKENWWRRIRK